MNNKMPLHYDLVSTSLVHRGTVTVTEELYTNTLFCMEGPGKAGVHAQTCCLLVVGGAQGSLIA